MRNFSMTKFGTPIPAAPGWARENVGLAGAGEPSGLTLGVEDRRFVFRVFRGVGLGHGGAAWAELPRAGASRAVRIAGRRELVLPGAGRGVQGPPGLVPGFLPGCGGLTGGGVGVTSTVTGAGTVASWEVVRVVVPSVLGGIAGVVSLVDVLAVVVATVFGGRPGERASPPGPERTVD